MLTSQQKVFRKFWHATVPLSSLQGETPQPFTLLGENIVLFLDEQGQPAALKDRCCHRTAKLSKGRCIGGRLECGYHGWTYNGTGKVVRIPQYDEGRAIPADYCTPAYRCVGKYGYAWVALEEPIAPIPDMPEFDAPGWRTIFQFYERWATSPLRALENSFDNSHFSFVHRATFGVADQPKPSKYELVEQEHGFYAETIIAAANPVEYQRVTGLTDAITTRHMRNAYYLPFSRRLDIEYPPVQRQAGCAPHHHQLLHAHRRRQHPAGAMAVPQRHRSRLRRGDAGRVRPCDHARGQGHPRIDRPRRAGRHAPPRHRVFDGQRPPRHADPQEADGTAGAAWRGRGAPRHGDNGGMTAKTLFGFHAIGVRLKTAPGSVVEVHVDATRRDQRMRQLVERATAAKVRIVESDDAKLTQLCGAARHQGVVAMVTALQQTHSLDDLLDAVEGPPLLLVLDGVTDPHNLGACLRVADGAGVHAVLAPKDHAVGLNATVAKVASGAAETVPYLMVTNLARTLNELKERDILVVGTSDDAPITLYEADLKGAVALVLGAEGKGLRQLTRKTCDVLVRIPMHGAVESLNVSVASGVCLYEARRQRGG